MLYHAVILRALSFAGINFLNAGLAQAKGSVLTVALSCHPV